MSLLLALALTAPALADVPATPVDGCCAGLGLLTPATVLVWLASLLLGAKR